MGSMWHGPAGSAKAWLPSFPFPRTPTIIFVLRRVGARGYIRAAIDRRPQIAAHERQPFDLALGRVLRLVLVGVADDDQRLFGLSRHLGFVVASCIRPYFRKSRPPLSFSRWEKMAALSKDARLSAGYGAGGGSAPEGVGPGKILSCVIAKIRILCYTLTHWPNRDGASPDARQRGEGECALETFRTGLETASDLFIFFRRNPLKSLDSDE